MDSFHNFNKFLLAFLFAFLLLIGISTFASSEEKYVFERMWPTLQQPWYFNYPYDVAADQKGNIYVADSGNFRIQKFAANGQLITKWGSYGGENGKFGINGPKAIVLDNGDNVYVADTGNHRIQKFTLDGRFIAKWGIRGSGDGELSFPEGITVSIDGDVYVVDTGNHRIQKFTSDGQFVFKWGVEGSGDGEFNNPRGIATDENGNIYVVDSWNNRIQKFTSDGQFITEWGVESGMEKVDGSFLYPSDIEIDESGNIYVADTLNDRIQKFNSEGHFILKWGSGNESNDDGGFDEPRGLAINRNGDIYVADTGNHRIQKFTSDGQFINAYGAGGRNDGMFMAPQGIAKDDQGNIYVVDSDNHCIQKFTADGRFLTKWGSKGGADGEFTMPGSIAVDSTGNVYVGDSNDYRIQKFNSNGDFIAKWKGTGSPQGLAVDRTGNVYATDTYHNRVLKFTSGGELITEWDASVQSLVTDGDQYLYGAGSSEDSPGDYVYYIQKFNLDGHLLLKWEISFYPFGIAVDENGNIYVADGFRNRIHKFSPEGTLILTWGSETGEGGSNPGQMSWPYGLTVSSNGNVYVTEYSGNHRVQVFKKSSTLPNSKAIIVAGGGPYAGNNLWDATQMSANFAYRTLTYQGFTKESIYYITSDTDLDLDNNGVLDDVDNDTTNYNLQQAITTWAADADSLVLYLVDHGGDGTFRMSGTETLNASDLDLWLDQLQQTIIGKVTVIYDACESGSFLSSLTPESGTTRFFITSTKEGEQAKFVSQGSVSFSNYFWTHIFNGVDIKNAFSLAKDALIVSFDDQSPLLDANGNGVGNEDQDYVLTENYYIGNGTIIHGDAPVIGNVSGAQTISGMNSAVLSAYNVTDNDGIARVWAVIRPPDYNQGSSDNPVNELPSIDLMPVGGDQYETTYNEFNIEGTYQIAIYAMDRIGNTSVPQLTTVSVNNPLTRKAIIVAGGLQTDDLWPSVEQSTKLVYEALSFQGYSDDDIYLMSPASIPGVTKLPVLSTLSNLEYAITSWALSDTQDVVLYMVGNGGYGTFEINDTETLTATDLDTWLDTLQANITGKVTLIYDACRSGSFLPSLTPPQDKERILVSSSSDNQSAYFISDGDISFSKFFWRRVLNGMNVRDSFIHSKNAILYACQGQTPQMDDNGNGIGNEKPDGQLARNYTIGVGIMLAGDDPLIGSVSSDQTLNGETSSIIWAEDVTTTGTIDKVFAIITPPNHLNNVPERPVDGLSSLELLDNGSGRYEGTYTDFSTRGIYNIAVYAIDTNGNISTPSGTRVIQGDGSSGWNLISLNDQPTDTDISSVLSSISGKYVSVWAYIDGSWKVYDPANPGFSDLMTMEAGKGYWININESGSLSFTGSDPSASISLASGWNLVGYNSPGSQSVADALTSIAGKYISIWAYINGGWKVYDPNNPGFSDLTTMEPGYGYWINTTEECTWTLP